MFAPMTMTKLNLGNRKNEPRAQEGNLRRRDQWVKRKITSLVMWKACFKSENCLNIAI